MKLLLLVFAALRFLVTPASAGGTRCGRTLPGHCRLYCGFLERPLFMCDRYRQCCVKDSVMMPRPILPPSVQKSKHPCRKNTKSQNKKPEMHTTPKPLGSPKTQRIITTPRS
ncbi:beta-defensin 132 [Artibeus jamaicensis]|uniref:beta-defensin 132 n=1 Tax=Artibeus jamaicensis TaxID=9417 RepID=UPI00235ABFF2|nr:beta-defensin 132 [Artibeus jamaicensis]